MSAPQTKRKDKELQEDNSLKDIRQRLNAVVTALAIAFEEGRKPSSLRNVPKLIESQIKGSEKAAVAVKTDRINVKWTPEAQRALDKRAIATVSDFAHDLDVAAGHRKTREARG